MATTYFTSDGKRLNKSQVDRRIRQAKQKFKERFLDENDNHIFCEECRRNDCVPVDISHDISVKKAQETGRTELAWDIENMTFRGRSCHQKHDKSGLIPGGRC